MQNIIAFKPARLLPGFSLALAATASPARVKALDEMQSMFERRAGARIEDQGSKIEDEEPREAPLHPQSTIHNPQSPPLTHDQICTRGYRALKKLTGFIGPSQLAFVKQALRGEEGEWFMEKMEELAAIVEKMPKTYETDGQGDDAICYLHYFGGSYDGYLTEKDMEESEDPAEAQWQAHGYVHWAHMPESAECGYICLPELFKNRVELDFHFEPTALREIKRKHGVSVEDPSDLSDLSEIQTPSDTDNDTEPAPLPKPADNAPAEPVAGQLHIRIQRAEGHSEECTPHHYADFPTAWACLQAHGHTAPAGGGYDKTDVCVTFPDGQAWAYRYDLTHGGSDSGDGCDFATNLRNRISFYAGRWTPDWMIAKGRPNNFIEQPEPEAVAILDTWSHLLTLEPPTPKSTGIFGGWETLSEQIPQGAILFIRLGDFYETFAHHAKLAAPLLQVALTKRKLVPMCGFPVHAADSYIQRLVEADHAVMLASFDPATGKATVQRTITRQQDDGIVSDEDLAETTAILQQSYLTREEGGAGYGWQVGAVMVETWGYEQTNKDFYQIVERKGDWLTLVPLDAIQTRHKDPAGTDAMRGTSLPGPSKQDAKPMRRKIRHGSYGPIAKGEHGHLDLWKGTPESWTDYA